MWRVKGNAVKMEHSAHNKRDAFGKRIVSHLIFMMFEPYPRQHQTSQHYGETSQSHWHTHE